MRSKILQTLLAILFVLMLGFNLAMAAAWIVAGWESIWIPYAALTVGVLFVALLLVWALVEEGGTN